MRSQCRSKVPFAVKQAPKNAVWYLRQHRLFAGAPDDAISSCKHIFIQRTYAERSVLFEQGDPASMVYLIMRGKVRIARVNADGKEMTIGILGPGDIFGEELVSRDSVRTTQAAVIEEAYICLSRMQDLFAIFARHPIVAFNIAMYLQEQRDAAIAIVEDLTFLKVRDRLIRLLVRLSEDHGVAEPRGIRIDLRLRQSEIASLVGSSRETVSLELGRLIRGGQLVNRDGFLILPKALQPPSERYKCSPPPFAITVAPHAG